jgi:hypothetical protein
VNSIAIASAVVVKLFPAVAAVGFVVGTVRISLLYRARAMRLLASRWGLQYIGPSAFRWRYSLGGHFLSLTKIEPAFPIPFSLGWWPGNESRQVWNVIEGQPRGVSVLIFDSFIGEGRGMYRTFMACMTEKNAFTIDSRRDKVIHSHGWTIVYRTPFPLEIPWATWSIGVAQIEGHLSKLLVGSGLEA